MTIDNTNGIAAIPGWRLLVNRHTGERLLLRRTVQDGEVCLELKGSLPPHNDGPPLHVHDVEVEQGRVVAGTLSAEVGGRQIEVEAGGAVLLPAGVPHRWWNAGERMLVFEGFTRPAVDLDVYLSAVFEILNSGPVNRPPIFYMAHLAWRHRRTQAVLLAPRWLQRVVVPAIVLVGSLLGRYRGTDWPGCPDRFAAAPLAGASAALPDVPPVASLA
jgi:mannose-6-phosphate isomerase-like protein (cupin superfamily)